MALDKVSDVFTSITIDLPSKYFFIPPALIAPDKKIPPINIDRVKATLFELIVLIDFVK